MRLHEIGHKPRKPVKAEGEPITRSNGVVAQGFRPTDDEDLRYFERLIWPDGTEKWYVLRDEADR